MMIDLAMLGSEEQWSRHCNLLAAAGRLLLSSEQSYSSESFADVELLGC
jgi:hypothetical protein